MEAIETYQEAMTEERKYFIDESWYRERRRSFLAVAQARFCLACRERIGELTQERVPVADPHTGRVVFEFQPARYGDKPTHVIANCCSKTGDYITPETPVMEAIFRLFLANGNQPADVDTLREKLEEYIALYCKPHGYAPELLERLIAADDFYGIREFAPGALAA
ncbi:MAG: hypothetical protein HY691_00285 [Chloroflexi bacterium]|nr:hypothetical protein [Chloroflexota bacterium]